MSYQQLHKGIKLDVFTEEGDEGELVVRIDSIIVPKSKRFGGIGRTEVENIIRWAREIGAEYIVLESERPAIPFWQKMGFDIDDQGSSISTGILQLVDKRLDEQILRIKKIMGLREDYNYDADDREEEMYDGFLGAGILPFCRSTHTFLVGLRSEDVSEGECWGLFGGKVEWDEYDDLTGAALREVGEEVGYHGGMRLKAGYVYKEPRFVYHNYIGIVDEEFEPRLNWEHTDAMWVTYQELLELPNKHFGLVKFLQNSKQMIESLMY